jgi:uncharacterized protein (DUF2062 family)
MRVAVLILASRRSPVPDSTVTEARRSADGVFVVEHPKGAGASVREGIEKALELQFTHFIVLDIDRDQLPQDIPAFIASVREHPLAVSNGVRQLPPGRLPVLVRLAGFFCDLWIWCATGHWTAEAGHGYRAYPLAAVHDLALRSRGVEISLEMLVKLIWAGDKVVNVPVTIRQGARSRLMTPAEFVRFGWLICSLLVQRITLPAPLRNSMTRGEFGGLPLTARLVRIVKQAILHHCDQPASFSAAVGLGVFFGIAPIWGLQMIFAAIVAHVLRLSKAVMVAASNISFPLTIPFILYASLLIGHVLHVGELRGMPRPNQLQKSVVLQYLGEYVVGSIVLAIVSGLIAAVAAYFAAKAVKVRRERLLQLSR